MRTARNPEETGGAVLVAFLFSVVALAGCLSENEGKPPEPVPPAGLPSGIQRYGALPYGEDRNGTPLGREGLPGTTHNVLTGFNGGEPNMGSTSDGTLFVTAMEKTVRSADGGRTWNEVFEFTQTLGAFPERTRDPMLWVDSNTDRVWVAHMIRIASARVNGLPVSTDDRCTDILWSDDRGATWTQRDFACGSPGLDHPKLVTGLPGPQGLPGVAFLCYSKQPVVQSSLQSQSVAEMSTCSESHDGGLTWSFDLPPFWSNLDAPPGTGRCTKGVGHPAIAPNGTVVVPKAWDCNGLFLFVSSDSGVSWTMKTGPQIGGETIDPDIAFTPDGTLYALWQATDHRPYLARSPDLGETWDGPWLVAPPGVRSTVFAAISGGDDGRVAMAFLGTSDSDKHPNDVANETRWHLFTVTSEDAGSDSPTFTSYRVTADEDPVQIGCVWLGGGATDCRNLLDFIDSAVGPDGTFYVSYTDGCVKDCADDPGATQEDSRSSEVAVAWLGGWSLRETTRQGTGT